MEEENRFYIVKKDVFSKEIIKIIKSYRCYGLADRDIKMRADGYCRILNLLRIFFDKYYYEVNYNFGTHIKK